MQKSKLSWFLKLMLALSLAFLYILLVVLVIYSFNESKLVTVWGGFSTKWYGALLENDTILEAAGCRCGLPLCLRLPPSFWARWQAMRWRGLNVFAAVPCSLA